MYTPAPFLISSAALTSIFSFFFGGYFRERQKAYQLWIQFMAYEGERMSSREAKYICAELEAKERVFRQAKGLLKILLSTLVAEFAVFQWYSWKYVAVGSPFHQADALHTYLCFNTIIGIIVLINCFEMLYIHVAVSIDLSARFPYVMIRKRVTGQDRLSMLWDLFDCPHLKAREFHDQKIPGKFYEDYAARKKKQS